MKHDVVVEKGGSIEVLGSATVTTEPITKKIEVEILDDDFVDYRKKFSFKIHL